MYLSTNNSEILLVVGPYLLYNSVSASSRAMLSSCSLYFKWVVIEIRYLNVEQRLGSNIDLILLFIIVEAT